MSPIFPAPTAFPAARCRTERQPLCGRSRNTAHRACSRWTSWSNWRIRIRLRSWAAWSNGVLPTSTSPSPAGTSRTPSTSPRPCWRAGGQRFSVEDLRFSTPDVARFFGAELTDRQVASLARESRGWPIALRLLHNEGEDGALVVADDAADVADNWVESRLWRGLAEPDRDMLLDVGLFERIDAALLNEVLETHDAKRRVEAIPALVGLIESVGGAESGVLRLHPADPGALRPAAFPGEPGTVPADPPGGSPRRWRGAARPSQRSAMRREAGDPALVGEILEARGGVRLWQREGLVRLQAVDRFVTEEVVERYPRTALARCVVLILSGRARRGEGALCRPLGEAPRRARGRGGRRHGPTCSTIPPCGRCCAYTAANVSPPRRCGPWSPTRRGWRRCARWIR